MTKKDMHFSTLARSFGIMTITVEVGSQHLLASFVLIICSTVTGYRGGAEGGEGGASSPAQRRPVLLQHSTGQVEKERSAPGLGP